MRFRFLNHPEKAIGTGMPGKIGAGSGILALGAALCVQSIIAGPLHAAPTVGGDEEGPKVQILQPGYQDLLKGSAKILVGIQVSKFNPDTIEFLVDDNVVLAPTKIGFGASSQFDWDTTKFTDGPHKLTVRITDTQGYRGWAEVYVFINNAHKRDTIPPSLDWLNVKQGQILAGTQQLQLKAIDNFGVKWIIVSLNSESTPDAKPPLRSWLVNRAPYSINFDTTVVPDGVYVLQAKAWDIFEQEGIASPLYVGISNTGVATTRISESLEQWTRQASVANVAAVSAGSSTGTAPVQTPRNTQGLDGNGSKPANTGGSTPVKTPTNPVTAPGNSTPSVPATAGGSAPLKTPTNAATAPGNPTPNVPANTGGSKPHVDSVQVPLPPALPTVDTVKVPLPTVPAAPREIQVKNPANAKAYTPNVAAGASAPNGEPRPLPANPVRVAVSAERHETTTSATPALTPNVARPHSTSQGGRDANIQPESPTRLAVNTVPDMTPREVPGRDLTPAALSPSRRPEMLGSTPMDPGYPNSDPSTRNLHPGTPEGGSRETPTWDQASLSARNEHRAAAERPRFAELDRTEMGTTVGAPERTATPDGDPRLVLDAATMSTTGNGARTSISSPVSVTVSAPEDHAPTAPTQPTLLARAVESVRNFVGLGSPALTHTATPEVVGTGRVSPTLVKEGRTGAAGRASEPKMEGAPMVAEQPAGPQLSHNPRFAMRPNTDRPGAIKSAITVSPIQLEAARSLPAFHTVRQTTTLKAVALHYGLTADVLAACNDFGVDAKLTAGTKVKLPQELQVSFAGKPVKGDVSSLMVGSTSVTPFRFLWEQQGGKLEWDAAHKQVIATNADHKVVLSIGSKTAKVDDKDVMMELAAFLMSGRTMVPVRVFEEGLHAQVEWDPSTGRLFVAMASDAS